jgi:signal transduction histidine kinase
MNIVISIPDDLWDITADESLITQLINNIVSKHATCNQSFNMSIRAENKAIKNGEIPLLCVGEYVVLYVENTVSESKEKHLSMEYKKNITSGFELSEAFFIVRQYNGTIRLYSKLGKGLSFIIYIPVTNHQFSATSQLQAA